MLWLEVGSINPNYVVIMLAVRRRKEKTDGIGGVSALLLASITLFAKE